MPGTKTSALVALTTLADGDLLPIVDISDTTQAPSGSTKKVTAANVGAYVATNGAFTAIERAPVTASVKPFDNRLSLYNWKPSNTAKLRKALAMANNGGLGKVAFIGDSITVARDGGGNLIYPFRDAYPYQLVRALEAKGMSIAGEGPVFANNGSNTSDKTDTRWVFGVPANWDVNFTQLATFTTTNGATATFTSTRPGTTVEIWTIKTASGTWTYSIDGATPVAVAARGAGDGTVEKITVTGLADTTHTVLITTTSTAVTWLLAVSVLRSTGLQIVNVSISGTFASTWATSTGLVPFQSVKEVAPHATFVMLEANDAAALTASATYVTNLTTIVNNAKVYGDVVLMVSTPMDTTTYPTKHSAYDPLVYQVADATDVPVIDWEHHFVNWATFDALDLNMDVIHITRVAHGDMAEILSGILSSGTRQLLATEEAARQIWIPQRVFGLYAGAVAEGFTGVHKARMYDKDADEYDMFQVRFPPGWATVAIDVWWSQEAAGAGNVMFAAIAEVTAIGGNLNTGGPSWTFTADAAPAQRILKKTTATTTLAVTPTSLYSILFGRVGTNLGDTLPNDAGVLGVMFREVS